MLTGNIHSSWDGCLSVKTLWKRQAAFYNMSPASLISLICLQSSLYPLSVSVPLFGNLTEWVLEQRQMQGLQSLCCDWKEDQGSSCKNIPMVHLPPALIPARNFPTYYRAGMQIERRDRKCHETTGWVYGKKKTYTEKNTVTVKNKPISLDN